MSDVEIITLVGLLALLITGVVLMLGPIKSDQERRYSAAERVEPQAYEELLSFEVRESFRQVQEANDAATPLTIVEPHDGYSIPESGDETESQTNSQITQSADEELYLEATTEVDSDNRQPALWAKVMTLNEGDEEKARYHYTRLRAEQMIGKLQTPDIYPTKRADRALTDGIDASVTSRAMNSEERGGTVGQSEVFDRNTVVDAINQRIPLGRIASARLLSDYSVAEYITKDVIRKKAVERGSIHHDAASYFDNYHHRTSVKVTEVLKNFEAEVAKRYLENRRFPHPYVVDFFDEVLIGTILPGSSRMEFLVLSPAASLDDELFKGLMASSSITELFMAAASERENPLILYEELENIFEHFSNSKA